MEDKKKKDESLELARDFLSTVKAELEIKKEALTNADKADQRQFEFNTENTKLSYDAARDKRNMIKRVLSFAMFIIFILVAFSIYLVYEGSSIGVNMLIGIFSGLGGLVAGYGFGKTSVGHI